MRRVVLSLHFGHVEYNSVYFTTTRNITLFIGNHLHASVIKITAKII